MRLTNRSEYALLSLAYLARLEPGAYAHGQAISKEQRIPRRFLQQILFALVRARIVRSLKGPRGGYCLNRPASSISLAEVVRLFEGALAPTRSASKLFYEATPIEKEKKMLGVFQELRRLVAGLLEETMLSDVI